MERMRIRRSISGRFDGAQGGVGAQRGFTLIEMMVTIGIMAILLAIAVGAWNALREQNRVEAAAEEIYSLMSAARAKALMTNRRQYVEIDFINDRVASTVWGGVYDSSAGTWAAGVSWKSYPGIDLVSANSSGVVNTAKASRLFSFSSRGTGVSASFLVQKAGGGSRKILITVNGVTGRVKQSTLP